MAKTLIKIRMLKTVQVGDSMYVGGKTYEVDQKTADTILETKLAKKGDSDDVVSGAPKIPFSQPAKDTKFEADADDKNKPFEPPNEDGDDGEKSDDDLDADDESEDDDTEEESEDEGDEKKPVRKPRKKRRK